MAWFKKKEEYKDLEAQFKEVYQTLNKVSNSIQFEPDTQIQVSLMDLCLEKYDRLLTLIDMGAPYDKDHFLKLKADMQKRRDLYKDL